MENKPVKYSSDKFMSACKNNDIEYVKTIIDQRTIKRVSRDFAHFTIAEAASNGHLEVVQYLLDSPNTNKGFYKYVEESFTKACSMGHLHVVQYLIENHSFSFLPDKKQTILHYSACTAAKMGHIQVIDYLFSLNHQSFQPEILKHGVLLCYACVRGSVESLSYLFSKPELKKHLDIHCEQDLPFKHICGSWNLDAIKYFIFDLNINKTDCITKFLDKDYNPDDKFANSYIHQAQEWFKLRQFNNSLEKELNENPQISTNKKLKI